MAKHALRMRTGLLLTATLPLIYIVRPTVRGSIQATRGGCGTGRSIIREALEGPPAFAKRAQHVTNRHRCARSVP